MRRKFGFLIIFFSLFFLILGGVKFLGNRTPKQGQLKVDSSSPVGIFLGTNHIGRSPYDEKTNAGEYTIKIVPESTVTPISSWQGNIQIFPNLLTYVSADLGDSEFTTSVYSLWLEKITSNVSEVAITTNPDGATVMLDGETRGVTPVSLSSVSAGDHTLAVSSPGFLTRTIRIKTTVGFRLNANIKLALFPQGLDASASARLSSSQVSEKTASQAGSVNLSKPYAVIKDTPTGFLRVRTEPTSSATEAARVNPGDKFSILDSQNGWYKVNFDGTKTGWISGQYVDKVE